MRELMCVTRKQQNQSTTTWAEYAGIKLATFDTAKSALVQANSAYDEELMQWQRVSTTQKSSSGLI